LRRRGFSNETIQKIDDFFTMVYFSNYNVSDGIAAYYDAVPEPCPEVLQCIEFIRTSKKGTIIA
ncbi:MAG TPA: acyl-[acyl-carrier-protein]--UDP-N-acetylglucosamine O-acyltransferase, partial [Candidatus Kapabacteria bacterium]|nr:acyl-[acyl-carrier-protein]--UDP-N-acetylglucosamine O-acyltransferase [Candidatus Kapabacteria bacterium]